MTADEPSAVPPEQAPLSLIYLDVDDEITSAAARIRAAGADDVTLVLPFGSRLSTSRINFRLLAREAAARGKRIEIVCADGSARALALAAGLPTHASVAALEAARSGVSPSGEDAGEGTAGDGAGSGGAGAATGSGAAGATTATAAATQMPLDLDDTRTHVLPTPRRKPERVPLVGPPRPPVRTGVAVGIGLAVIVAVIAGGLLALEFLPTATITLHPRSAAIGPVEIAVEAREDVTAPDPGTMTIPAQRFTFALAAEESFPATGVRVEQVKATGHVTFSNFDTGGANRIDAGSIVSTESGIEFVTLATVTLPNATIQFPFTLVPSTSTVEVQAVVAGPSGNVGNNTITVVPKGENKRLLQVTNLEATSRGARNESPQVSESDVEAARAALTAALIAELDRQVAAQEGVPASVTLFSSTRLAGTPEFAPDPETLVGTLSREFTLAATAEGSALGVDAAPIADLAEAALAGRVADGWSIEEASVETEIGQPSVIGTTIVYPLTIAATQVRDVDEAALLEAIQGLGLPEARALLDDYGDVEISVWPDWVTTIPTRADRITLTLGEPRPSIAP